MNAKLTTLFVSACALLLVLAGCPVPSGPGVHGGTMSITIGNAINKTLLPPISMESASYTINGSGPHGASFSKSTTSGSLTVDGLAFGQWTVTVNALNASGTVIGSGSASAEVHTGQTATMAITVTPLAGQGSLSVGVSWRSQPRLREPSSFTVARPSVTGQLRAATSSALKMQ